MKRHATLITILVILCAIAVAAVLVMHQRSEPQVDCSHLSQTGQCLPIGVCQGPTDGDVDCKTGKAVD